MIYFSSKNTNKILIYPSDFYHMEQRLLRSGRTQNLFYKGHQVNVDFLPVKRFYELTPHYITDTYFCSSILKVPVYAKPLYGFNLDITFQNTINFSVIEYSYICLNAVLPIISWPDIENPICSKVSGIFDSGYGPVLHHFDSIQHLLFYYDRGNPLISYTLGFSPNRQYFSLDSVDLHSKKLYTLELFMGIRDTETTNPPYEASDYPSYN